MAPRLAISIKRCVRVSSNVVLFPSLAATKACTRGSECSASFLNSSSVLANAHASLPVRALIFLGGATPSLCSKTANLSFDIKSSISDAAASNNFSLRSLTSSKCCSNNGKSNSRMGSTNILSVVSITLSSASGKDCMKMSNNS